MKIELSVNPEARINGYHHITSITSDMQTTYSFYTDVLGLRLVCKTINQDDYLSYECFFGDNEGASGTLVTFFDFPQAELAVDGGDQIVNFSFCVASDASVVYWKNRLAAYHISHREIYSFFGRDAIDFKGYDGQCYRILSEEKATTKKKSSYWSKSNIKKEHAITGIDFACLKVRDLMQMDVLLQSIFGFEKLEDQVYDIGNACTLIVEETQEKTGHLGYGSIHHISFAVEDNSTDFEQIRYWEKRLYQLKLPVSPFMNRTYFGSVYTQIAPNILFSLASKGQDFWETKEEESRAGEFLQFPENLFPDDEAVRVTIMEKLRYLDTNDANEQRILEEM